MLIYIHIGQWPVSRPPRLAQLPASRSSSCGTLSWTEGPSCHRRGAPGSSRRACGLGSSTWSRAVRASSAAGVNRNMTTTGRAGSRADSPGSHTLSPPSSSCSLDYYIDAARCALATPAATPPCLEVPDRPAARSPRTLLTTVHFLARAQVPGLCDRAPPPAAPSPRRTAVTLTAAAHPAQRHRRRARGGSLAVAARRRALRCRCTPRRVCVGGVVCCLCVQLVCVRVCVWRRRRGSWSLSPLSSLLACRAGTSGLRVFSRLQRNKIKTESSARAERSQNRGGRRGATRGARVPPGRQPAAAAAGLSEFSRRVRGRRGVHK